MYVTVDSAIPALARLPKQVEQLVDSGRGFLASLSGPFRLSEIYCTAKHSEDTAQHMVPSWCLPAFTEAETILFLVFYAPTIDNREAESSILALGGTKACMQKRSCMELV